MSDNTVSSNSERGESPVQENGNIHQRRKNSKIGIQEKELLIKLIESGKSITEAARFANIKINTAKTIYKRYKDSDCEIISRKRGGNNPKKLTPTVLQKIEQCIEKNPGITIREIQRRLLREDNIHISRSSVDNGLRELKITLKLASVEVDRMNSSSTIELRKQYAAIFSRYAPQDRKKIIFIDESGFNLHLRRSQARSKRNTRAIVTVPTVRGRNITLIAAMNSDGIIHTNIISNSTCNAAKFLSFLEELFSKLGDCSNTWIVMDNAKIHKTQQVQEFVISKNCRLEYLPPYSPMLNPIEKAFSKIKSSARNILADLEVEHDLLSVIRRSVSTITQTDSVNYVMDMMIKLGPASAGEPIH